MRAKYVSPSRKTGDNGTVPRRKPAKRAKYASPSRKTGNSGTVPPLSPQRGRNTPAPVARLGTTRQPRAASPQRGRNTLAPVARLGTAERPRAPARFSGRKNHCAQTSFVLYRAMAGNPCSAEFARRFALDPLVQDWEQGRRRPDRAARAYLTGFSRHPGAVLEALAS